MPREYYVYPNGTSIAIAGNNEYATQIPMSAATTLTLQGVTANDQNTDRTSAVTWHVFYR